MAKKYIFLTNSLAGISGGPSYVNNKKQWLCSIGWEVFAFDGYNNLWPIEFNGLKEYKHNRVKALRYHPSWLTKSINKVIERILLLINYEKGDECVIETHTPVLAEWGELFAQYIKCKHIVYLIGEHVIITDHETFDFLWFKYRRNEIFSISAKAFSNLFSKFYQVNDSENHYWNSNSITKAERTNTKAFNNLPSHDFVITQFGRWKAYFPSIIPELKKFVDANKDKHFLFIIVGGGYSESRIKNLLKSCNLEVLFFEEQFPIPQELFDISNAVIATAGCAMISFYAGSKTISMDVESLSPLGVLGYTTKEISYRYDDNDEKPRLSDVLNDILINKKYDGTPLFNPFDNPCGYDFQMNFLTPNDNRYYDGLYSSKAYGVKQSLYKVLIWLGLVSIPLYIDYLLLKIFKKQ